MKKNSIRSFINENKLNNWLNWYIVFFFIFYISAYLSVTNTLPSSTPVHHDDYSNYARTLNFEDFSFIRPVSTFVIQLLSAIDPSFLIWSVRFLTVLYVLQIFYISEKIFDLKLNPVVKILTSILIFSSPIIVEYARYTGMITQAFLLGLLVEYAHIHETFGPLIVTIVLLPLTYLMSKKILISRHEK